MHEKEIREEIQELRSEIMNLLHESKIEAREDARDRMTTIYWIIGIFITIVVSIEAINRLSISSLKKEITDFKSDISMRLCPLVSLINTQSDKLDAISSNDIQKYMIAKTKEDSINKAIIKQNYVFVSRGVIIKNENE
jgi:hypothetical protein